jgi:hypothetical protein
MLTTFRFDNGVPRVHIAIISVAAMLLNSVVVPFAVVFSRAFDLKSAAPLIAQSIFGLVASAVIAFNARQRYLRSTHAVVLVLSQLAAAAAYRLSLAYWPTYEPGELFFAWRAFGPAIGLACVSVATLLLCESGALTKVAGSGVFISAATLALYLVGGSLSVSECVPWLLTLLRH